MTTKIQLPPNLARHFYEARRRYLQSSGVTITPWFQLTALERLVTEQETDLVRQAMEAAETEQAIRDQLQPGKPREGVTAEPLEDPAPPAEPAAAASNDSGDEEDCGHEVCRAVRSLLKAFEQPEPDFVDAYTNPDLIGPETSRPAAANRVDTGDAVFTVIPLDTRPLGVPLTAAELDQVQRAAAAAGQTPDEFMRAAVLDAAADPFLMALEKAADTIAARDQIQHGYAN